MQLTCLWMRLTMYVVNILFIKQHITRLSRIRYFWRKNMKIASWFFIISFYVFVLTAVIFRCLIQQFSLVSFRLVQIFTANNSAAWLISCPVFGLVRLQLFSSNSNKNWWIYFCPFSVDDKRIFLIPSGFLWKDKTPDGVRAVLEERLIPLDRLLVETDAPYMYPNIKASKVPKHIKEALTEQSLSFLTRHCSFQRNEPCSLPITVEMIAAYMKTTPQVVALSTTQNALKVFGLMWSFFCGCDLKEWYSIELVA